MANKLTRILRERIIEIHYRPGSPLSEKKLAEEFEVSRTPIREALIRLSQEDLVTLLPHSVARVSDINLHDFKQLIQCRLVLERGGARMAAMNATEHEIQELEKLRKRSLKIKKNDPGAFVRHDSELHRIIRKAAANSFMERYLSNVQNHFTRIQYLIAHTPDRTRLHDELVNVIKALRNRDHEALEALLVDHVERFVVVVRNYFKIY
jgi:DNA-binding GntR family transcriptional regulator